MRKKTKKAKRKKEKNTNCRMKEHKKKKTTETECVWGMSMRLREIVQRYATVMCVNKQMNNDSDDDDDRQNKMFSFFCLTKKLKDIFLAFFSLAFFCVYFLFEIFDKTEWTIANANI